MLPPIYSNRLFLSRSHRVGAIKYSVCMFDLAFARLAYIYLESLQKNSKSKRLKVDLNLIPSFLSSTRYVSWRTEKEKTLNSPQRVKSNSGTKTESFVCLIIMNGCARKTLLTLPPEDGKQGHDYNGRKYKRRCIGLMIIVGNLN